MVTIYASVGFSLFGGNKTNVEVTIYADYQLILFRIKLVSLFYNFAVFIGRWPIELTDTVQDELYVLIKVTDRGQGSNL